jgi:hypothetical protein
MSTAAAETLTGRLTRITTMHAGQHAKVVPAGTLITVRTEAFEDGNRCVYVRVASSPRIAEVIAKTMIEAI